MLGGMAVVPLYSMKLWGAIASWGSGKVLVERDTVSWGKLFYLVHLVGGKVLGIGSRYRAIWMPVWWQLGYWWGLEERDASRDG